MDEYTFTSIRLSGEIGAAIAIHAPVGFPLIVWQPLVARSLHWRRSPSVPLLNCRISGHDTERIGNMISRTRCGRVKRVIGRSFLRGRCEAASLGVGDLAWHGHSHTRMFLCDMCRGLIVIGATGICCLGGLVCLRVAVDVIVLLSRPLSVIHLDCVVGQRGSRYLESNWDSCEVSRIELVRGQMTL